MSKNEYQGSNTKKKRNTVAQEKKIERRRCTQGVLQIFATTSAL